MGVGVRGLICMIGLQTLLSSCFRRARKLLRWRAGIPAVLGHLVLRARPPSLPSYRTEPKVLLLRDLFCCQLTYFVPFVPTDISGSEVDRSRSREVYLFQI